MKYLITAAQRPGFLQGHPAGTHVKTADSYAKIYSHLFAKNLTQYILLLHKINIYCNKFKH